MTVLTFAALYPLSVRLGTEILHGARDKYIFLWDLWWVQHALTSLHQTPLSTDFLFAPFGISLSYHTLNLTNGIIGIFLGSKGNIILAHNLLLVISFIFSGYFTYLLVLELTHSRVGALFGAILFTFGPARWLMVWNGQMNLSSTQWIPLFLFLLIRCFRRKCWLYPVLMALSLIAIFHTSFQQMVFTFTMAVLLMPPLLIERHSFVKSNRCFLLPGLILFLVLFFLLASPMLIEMWQNSEESTIIVRDLEWRNMSVEPERILYGMKYYSHWDEVELPGPLSRVLSAIRPFFPKTGPVIGFVTVLLILAGWGSLFCKGEGRWHVIYWSLSLFLFIWMMMGPEPCIMRIRIPSIAPLLQILPGFNAVRGVIRYTIPMTLAAAILSGYIFARIDNLLNGRNRQSSKQGVKTRRLAAAISSLLVIALYGEFFKVPLEIVQLPTAPKPYYESGVVHQDSDDEADTGTLLELPYWWSGGGFSSKSSHYETLYYQTIHQRRMLGGHISRLAPSMAPESTNDPVLAFFSHVRLAREQRPTSSEIMRCFSEFDVRFVNVSRRRYRTEEIRILREILEEGLDAQIIHSSNAFLTYELSGHTNPALHQN